MLDPNKSTGHLDTAACNTLLNSDGFRTNSLFDAWRHELQLSNQGHFRGTRNGGDRQLLLDILDEALEITSFPVTSTATNNSLEQINQRQSLQAETTLNSDGENRVSDSVNAIDIDSTSENTIRGQIPRTGSNVKQRRANEKLPDRNRQ